MKRLFVFLIGMMLFLQQGNAQFPLARHFWLNPNSYNHTLSPTSDGGYILAAAREEQNGAGFKNTIAVFKLDNAYNIQNSRIIGILGTGGSFDVGVDFEVHDVVENIYISGESTVISYVICGSISRSGSSPVGMVAVVNAALNTRSIREYPDAEVFYSVYTDGNYFYVCGSTPQQEGIVMRDYIQSMNPTTTAYVTGTATLPKPWEYHKIKVNNNGNDLVVSGTDYNEMGFTAFTIAGGNFAPIVNPFTGMDVSWRHQLSQPILSQPRQLQPNSKVVVANDPNNPQGLILSVMTQIQSTGEYEMHAYLCNNYVAALPLLISAYRIRLPLYNLYGSIVVLEDVTTSPNGEIAWTGYEMIDPAIRGGFFLKTNLPFLPPPFIPPLVTPINFYPSAWGGNSYTRLYKVHYHNGDFHCGGYYYDPDNNDITTLVVAPQQAIVNGAACNIETRQDSPISLPLPTLTPLPITQMTVSVLSNPWHQRQYRFCSTDCDNTPLVPNNCGN